MDRLVLALTAAVVFVFLSPTASAALLGPQNIQQGIVGTGISGDLSELTTTNNAGVTVSSVDVGVDLVDTLRPSADVNESWLVPSASPCLGTAHYACIDESTFVESGPSSWDVSDYITTGGGTADLLDEYNVTDDNRSDVFWNVAYVSVGYAWARNQSVGNPAWWTRWSLVQTNGTPCVQFLVAPASSTAASYWWPFPSCSWVENGTSFSVPWTITLVNSLTMRVEWIAPHVNTVTIFVAAVSVHVHARVQEAAVFVWWGAPGNSNAFPVSSLTWQCTEGGDTSVVWQIGSLSADGCDGTVHSASYTLTGITITGNPSGAASNAFSALFDILAVGEPAPNPTPPNNGLSWIFLFAIAGGTALYLAWRFHEWLGD